MLVWLHILLSRTAAAIGMTRGTFNNKLKGNRNANFSIGEIDKIESFLLNICKKMSEVGDK
jgi:hypothetical protein